MFGKKAATNSEIDQTISVQTIPADFYGGVNPVIRFKRVEKEVVLESKPKLTAPEKKMLDKSTATGSGSALHPANILTNKKYAIIFGSSLFVAIVAGVSGYYYLQSRQQSKIAIPEQPKIVVETPVVQAPVVVETTTEQVVAPTTMPQSLADAPIEFPSGLLGESPDLDKDNLTDKAEELFGTDPSKPDTDGDGYDDGHEVYYLYNPAGKEPMRLIDSGYVNEYNNPIFGYKVFYPITWAVGNVDEGSRDVLFSTITGENIELRVFDRLTSQTFADWFAQWAPNEQYQNIADSQTKYGEAIKNRADNLVYYFMDDNHIYVMIYHTTDSNVVNYRSIMVMMARSFRSPGFIASEAPLPVSGASAYPTEMPSVVENTTTQ
ncbi:MAG: Fibronectin type III domain protein [Candidatus Magasanikbacteria bacterium GW2011_GWA2_40_10]|uniref:Fibronectin type III domain protein n=1 Tax=Candidatus Magasanikbacteria bacterium GW2011_GWA2_40_10 TaxID=1619037 RepID=A0A0G0QBL6_9BACT|nr:MAG: Fibronectin type III domain protein [Candidatus Magasanikbacteria bacterium GW2011_GWA2_40_10]